MRHILVLAAAAMLLWSCGDGKRGESEATPHSEEAEGHHPEELTLSERQVRAVGLAFGKVERKNLSEVIHVNGVTALNPQDKAEVAPLTGGILRSISVIEGSRVAKGQTVATIENTEIVTMQKDYLQSLSVLTQAEEELSRQRELSSDGAGIGKNLQRATSDLQIAQSAAMGLESQLRQLGIDPKAVGGGDIATQIPIKAPISGYVDKIYKATGSYADMQQPVMTIVNNEKMHIDINVYERDMAEMATGQRVDFTITNIPGSHLSGEIYEYSSSFVDETKALVAHVNITERGEGLKLIPGMYVTGTVQKGRSSVDAVPSTAISSSEGKDYVFFLEEADGEEGERAYHFGRVEVVTGAEELGYTQITPLGELPANADIVTRNAFYLSSILGEEADHSH